MLNSQYILVKFYNSDAEPNLNSAPFNSACYPLESPFEFSQAEKIILPHKPLLHDWLNCQL